MEEFVIDDEFLVEVEVEFDWITDGEKFRVSTQMDHPAFNALKQHLIRRELLEEVDALTDYPVGLVTTRFSINNKIFEEGEYIAGAERTKQHLERKVNFPPVLYP